MTKRREIILKRHIGNKMKFVSIQECDFDELVEQSDLVNKETYSNIVKEIETTFIPPRDFYFGGRVNALCLLDECEPNDNSEIKYFDFTSLYSAVMKTERYPLDHPEIKKFDLSSEAETDISNYFGLITCDVLPPDELHIPILPVKFQGKLFFPLCTKCMEEHNEQYCKHNDSERMLKGTWGSPELELALQYNYKILRIYTVLHYENSFQGDNPDPSKFFNGYVNDFLKLKIEASGWPSHCDTEEQKDAYIQEIFERENIQLDRDKIKRNNSLRNTIKLFLNSVYGKFGQNPNKDKHKIVDNLESFNSVAYNAENVLKDIKMLDAAGEKLLLIYANSLNNEEDNYRTSVVIASFVTMYGRIKLYKLLAMIQAHSPTC